MGLPKKLNYILLPLYQMWSKILEKFSLKNNVLLLDNKEIQGVVDVANITTIEDSVLNKLKVGDVVRKITNKQRHCYVVSYKEEEHGICLSYFDAGYTETVSYDYTEGHWVYNSTDVVPIPEEKSDAEIKALAKEEVESASSGTVQDVLGLDSGGNLVKGVASGGKVYAHKYSAYVTSVDGYVYFYLYTSNSDGPTGANLVKYFKDNELIVPATITSIKETTVGTPPMPAIHFGMNIQYNTTGDNIKLIYANIYTNNGSIGGNTGVSTGVSFSLVKSFEV